MRVTFNSSFNQSASDLSRVTEELLRRQREVSSGRRLNTASDDPSAAAGSVRERSELAAVGNYMQAADNASSRLAVVDSVLGDSLMRLTSAQTAILSARGTAVNATTREAAKNELIGIRDALYSNLNTAFRGTYLFGGSSGTVAPYSKAPNGTVVKNVIDDTPISTAVGHELAVQISYSAHDIAEGAADELFASLEQAIAAVDAADDTQMAAAAENLKLAFARVSAAQSHAGTGMNTIESQQTRLREMKVAGQARVDGHELANPAESISKMNQADTAYRVALGAIGASGKTTLMDYLR